MFGIVNVTPDSFSDGGLHADPDDAVAHGVALWQEGADILDVGGESTRPGAEPVDPDTELARVLPVIQGLRALLPDAVISIDTRRARVAEAALDAGATLVNDVSGAGDPDMAALVASRGAPIVLMHMRGDPLTMQRDTTYGDLVGDVVRALAERVDAVIATGVSPDQLWLDPGIGFGKAQGDNPRLITGLARVRSLGLPVLVGASRKRFIGELTGVELPALRVHGSVAAACAAMAHGADAVRVHDVSATIQALRVFQACFGGIVQGVDR